MPVRGAPAAGRAPLTFPFRRVRGRGRQHRCGQAEDDLREGRGEVAEKLKALLGTQQMK